MKIGSTEHQAALTALQNDRKSNAPEKSGTSAPTEASAQVALSPAASMLSKASADPTFDADKVERLAQAIRDGKFEVNSEKIADKLISNARELLGRYQS